MPIRAMNILVICYLFQVIRPNAALVCRNDQLVMEFPNGDLICASCPKCPPGFGTTFPCGGTVPAPHNFIVTCKPCMPGEYSDSLSSGSCKTCSKCLPGEAIQAKCSNTSDTLCSCKPCPEGYYRNKTKCLPCSECCSHTMDEEVPQCVSQNIPRSQTCIYQKRKLCASKCWHDEITVVRLDGKHVCQPCPVCSKESGLTVPCGSTVHEEMFIACKRPILGKTFVNQQGVLQACSICSPGQEVIDNCSSNRDAKCGGCKEGFYYNYRSKTCQECFLCCNHLNSDAIMNCIRQGMLLAELKSGFPTRRFDPPFEVPTQSVQTNHESHFQRLLTLDEWKLFLGSILIILTFLVWNFTFRRGQYSRNMVQKADVLTHDKEESSTRLHATQDKSIDTTEKVKTEYPVQQNGGHVVFEKTGVEVIAIGGKKSTVQYLPKDLTLQTTSNSAVPGFPEKGEIALSPEIKFISSTKLSRPVEVQIPHGANMVLSHRDWIISLKEFCNNKWVNVSQGGTFGQGIKNFVLKSNHVSFETDRLSTFAIVGKPAKNSGSALKRMKVVAFCSETRIEENLVVRLYCFDDCEYSFEKLTGKEKEEGGKLISSIESLDFSVGSKKDVEITVMDTEGWQLHQASPTKFGYNLLRSSFDNIPQCDLVFRPVVPGKSSFFVVLALTHEPSSDSKTVVYASTAIKNKEFPEDFGEKMKANQPVERKQVGNEKCIIQM